MHYYAAVVAAAIVLSRAVSTGADLRIRGRTTDLTHHASSLEVDRRPVGRVAPGVLAGLAVPRPVRPGDVIYRTGRLP